MCREKIMLQGNQVLLPDVDDGQRFCIAEGERTD